MLNVLNRCIWIAVSDIQSLQMNLILFSSANIKMNMFHWVFAFSWVSASRFECRGFVVHTFALSWIICLIDSILYSRFNSQSRLKSTENRMSTPANDNFLERVCHKYFQKNPKMDKEAFLKHLTHLYLNGRKLEKIVGVVQPFIAAIGDWEKGGYHLFTIFVFLCFRVI